MTGSSYSSPFNFRCAYGTGLQTAHLILHILPPSQQHLALPHTAHRPSRSGKQVHSLSGCAPPATHAAQQQLPPVVLPCERPGCKGCQRDALLVLLAHVAQLAPGLNALACLALVPTDTSSTAAQGYQNGPIAMRNLPWEAMF